MLFNLAVATPGHDMTADVFVQTTIVLVAAAVLGFLGSKLKQPVIIAYIAVGILAGPHAFQVITEPTQLELLASIGICILLFIVGLKLDLHMIRTMGPVALAAGFGQLLFTGAGGFALALALGLEVMPAVYVSIALTFSSTIIVVKLLSDKREIDALHGRIAIGVLIVQDIAVVLTMIALSAYGAGAASEDQLVGQITIVAVKGILFIACVLVLMRWGLPQLLHQLARTPELLVLFSIAWAVGLATLGEVLGFSKEVGAFLAGMSIASTPFRDAIGSRLVSLRDFLLLFFFIHLGASLELDTLGAAVGPAIVLSIFVLVGKPVIVVAILGALGYRKRTGLLSGLTLAQISEFSLILMGLVVALGQADRATAGLVTLVGLITIALSTYMILYSGPIYRLVSPMLSIFERKVPTREVEATSADTLHASRTDALIFGLGNYGGNLVRGLVNRGQHVIGVDFDPQQLTYWREQKVPVLYGDAGDPELLDHLPIRRARWVIIAMPDRAVAATLVRLLRHAGFPGKIAVTVRTEADYDHLKTLQPDLVFRPYADAADQAIDALTAAMHLMPNESEWPSSLKEVRLDTGSVWAGTRIGDIPLRRETGVSILAVSRAGKITFDPEATFQLFPGDHIVLLGEPDNLLAAVGILAQREFGQHDPAAAFTITGVDVTEVSHWPGRTLADLNFRREHGVTVIGIERGTERIRTLQAGTTLERGDRLIVAGKLEAVDALRKLCE